VLDVQGLVVSSVGLPSRNVFRGTLVAVLVISAWVGLGHAPSARAGALGASNAQRRAAAFAEAHQLLARALEPGGSRQLTKWTGADGPALAAAATPGSLDLVDVTRYFLAPNGVAALRWIQSHVPAGAKVAETGSGSGPNVATTYSIGFLFTSSRSYLTPTLEYSMLITPQGQLGMRLDAIVTWTPRKSPYSIVPSGARRVLVKVDRSGNVKVHRYTTLLVTASAMIRSFLAKVNRLPVANPGVRHCPLDLGASMTLSFSRVVPARPYAVVKIDPGGCGNVTITQYDATGHQIGVAQDSGGSALARYVATTLGIRDWAGMSALS